VFFWWQNVGATSKQAKTCWRNLRPMSSTEAKHAKTLAKHFQTCLSNMSKHVRQTWQAWMLANMSWLWNFPSALCQSSDVYKSMGNIQARE
jgi:hypothetical protein